MNDCNTNEVCNTDASLCECDVDFVAASDGVCVTTAGTDGKFLSYVITRKVFDAL